MNNQQTSPCNTCPNEPICGLIPGTGTCERLKKSIMDTLFNIPQNYNESPLFKTLDELRKFAEEHEEQLDELKIFDIHFDTDEWSQSIGGRLYTLERMIDVMETENYSYFEDVKSQHGVAHIGFESDKGEWIILYLAEY